MTVSHLNKLGLANAFDGLLWQAGGENVHLALDSGRQLLQAQTVGAREKAVLLVTDGVPSDRGAAIDAAYQARVAGIHVFVVGDHP